MGGEALCGVLELLRLLLVTLGARLVGQHQGLTSGRLQFLDVAELPVQLHLQLTLVADHGRGLLRERLVLTLDIAGATEIRTFDAKTLKPAGKLRFVSEP